MDRQVARRADGYGLWPSAHEVRRPERVHFGVRGPSIGWMRLQTTNAGTISRAVPDQFRALNPQRTPMAAHWQARPHAVCRNWVDNGQRTTRLGRHKAVSDRGTGRTARPGPSAPSRPLASAHRRTATTRAATSSTPHGGAATPVSARRQRGRRGLPTMGA